MKRSRERATFRVPLAMAIVLVASACLTGFQGLRAEEETLPDGAALLDKLLEASGGSAAYDKIRNRITRSSFEMPAAGLKMAMTIYQAKPNKNYTLMESEAIGKIERGTDGEVAWEKSMTTGPRIIEGEERVQFMRGVEFDVITRWREFYEKAECVGVENVNEKPAYKVVITPKEGDPETWYLDKESGLTIRVDITVQSPMGEVPVQSFHSDYREVDGIRMPHKVEATVMGQARVMTIESVEHNSEIPDDRFALPAEIRELLEPDEAEPEAPEAPPAPEATE
jgi:hypothetical protein